MKNALYLIPVILNHLLLIICIEQIKEKHISAIFYFHQHARTTHSAIFSIQRIKLFYCTLHEVGHTLLIIGKLQL